MRKALKYGRERQRSQCYCYVLYETQQAICYFEDESRLPRKKCRWPPQQRKMKHFSQSPEKEVSLASILIFSFCNLIFKHSDPFQNFDFRNHKIIDLCYFKPLFVVICYSSNRKLLQLSKSSVYLDKKSVFFVYVFCSFVISSLKSPGVEQGLGGRR